MKDDQASPEQAQLSPTQPVPAPGVPNGVAAPVPMPAYGSQRKSHTKLWIFLGIGVFVAIVLSIGAVIFTISAMKISAMKKAEEDFIKGNRVDTLMSYDSAESGVSFKVPTGWEVKKTLPGGSNIIELTAQPPAGSFANAFNEKQMVDLLCRKITSGMTKQGFVDTVIEEIIPGKEAQGFVVTSQAQARIGNLEAYRFEAAKQSDESRTTFSHAYYMASSHIVCSMYVLVITDKGGVLPVEAYTDDILESFRFDASQ